MAWSTETAATQLTSITSEQFFDQTPTLTPGETVHVQVSVDFPSSPTDDAIVSIYASLDGTDYDLTPRVQLRLLRMIDPNRVSVTLTGMYQFRVGVKRSGTTDTLTSADMSFRKNGVSL